MTKRMNRIRRRSVLAGAAALPLVASPARAQQKVLTIGSAFSPVSIDPSLSGNGRAGMAVIPAYEPLVRTGAAGDRAARAKAAKAAKASGGGAGPSAAAPSRPGACSWMRRSRAAVR